MKGRINFGFLFKILFWILIGILIVWAILIFFGYFDFIGNVELMDAEGIIFNKSGGYILITNFKSNGAFIEGRPIDFKISVRGLGGEKFVDGKNEFWVNGDCPAYNYPPVLSEMYDIYGSGIIKLDVIDNGESLSGKQRVFFTKPGECGGFKLIYQDEQGEQAKFYKVKSSIYISPSDVGLNIESNRRILSLTLILLAFALIEIRKTWK